MEEGGRKREEMLRIHITVKEGQNRQIREK
jgi:16S rRNA U516 pseudouridylate synthase RsuA-like enzyme